jgi:hypothetical protein
MASYKNLLQQETKFIRKWCSTTEGVKLRKLTSRYEYYDFTMEYESSIGLVEAKLRHLSYENIKEGGIILEVEKWSKILSKTAKLKDDPKYKHMNFQPYYLISFIDKTFLFQLDDLTNIRTSIELLPNHTAIDTKNKYIFKPVVYLFEEDAKIITKNP